MTHADGGAPLNGVRNRDRFALIGAGPMGLAMAKTLVEQGIPFRGFEMHSDVGGLWDIEGPRSTMYETAHLISSKTMTEFADFPMDEDVAEYPSHRELKSYFRRFADHFDLRRHYLFETEVLRTEPLGGDGEGWRVTWRDGDGTHEDIFAGVLIANGTLSEPNMPDFAGDFADGAVEPIPTPWSQVDDTTDRLILRAVDIVNDLPALMDLYDSMRRSAIDPYASVRDGFTQRRAKLVEE